MNTLFTARIGRFLAVAALLVSFILVSACSSDSPANQNAAGLYLNGTGTLDSVSSLSDITAFVYNNEIILHSATAHVLLKGTINSITESAYSATVEVYKNGSRQMPDVTVTGTVNTASQITGTLSGTGVGSGNFAITYSSAFNTSASFSKIAVAGGGIYWGGTGYSTENKLFVLVPVSASDGSYDGAGGDFAPNYCTIDNGHVSIPDSTKNIYRMSHDFIEDTNCQFIGVNFTGFASLIEATTPDTLLVAIANGTYSIFGTLQKIEP